MTVFYERLCELCTKAGSSPNAEAKKMGIPSGSITAWKNGSIPRIKTIQKMADYFQVSAAYLMGWAREPNELDRRILEQYPDYRLGKETIPEYLARKEAEAKKAPEPSQTARPEVSEEDIKYALFGDAGEITDEMFDEVKEFVKFLKMKHGQ
jgi:transcriptional regulator with XRE-family HTH domain